MAAAAGQSNRVHRCLLGVVASLHMHPLISGDPMTRVEKMSLVAAKGIQGNTRYYAQSDRQGKPARNHVSLLEREQIADHAQEIGLDEIPPGLVLSNIETTGIDLQDCVGFRVRIGSSAILDVYKARVPCARMDAIAPGLARQMRCRQGVLAQVEILPGNEIRIVD